MNQPLRWDFFGSIGGGGFARESSALMPFLCDAATNHLGNVRVVMNDAGLVEQVNQFYPYGEVTRTNHRGKTVITCGPTSNVIDQGATGYYYKHTYRSHKW